MGQGRDKTRDLLLSDPALFQAVHKRTLEALPSQAHRRPAPESPPKPDKGDKDKSDKKHAA